MNQLDIPTYPLRFVTFQVTLADAIVTAAVEFLHSMVPDSLDGLHNLRIIKENFQAIPAIREYIRNRPATSN